MHLERCLVLIYFTRNATSYSINFHYLKYDLDTSQVCFMYDIYLKNIYIYTSIYTLSKFIGKMT